MKTLFLVREEYKEHYASVIDKIADAMDKPGSAVYCSQEEIDAFMSATEIEVDEKEGAEV